MGAVLAVLPEFAIELFESAGLVESSISTIIFNIGEDGVAELFADFAIYTPTALGESVFYATAAVVGTTIVGGTVGGVLSAVLNKTTEGVNLDSLQKLSSVTFWSEIDSNTPLHSPNNSISILKYVKGILQKTPNRTHGMGCAGSTKRRRQDTSQKRVVRGKGQNGAYKRLKTTRRNTVRGRKKMRRK